MRAFIEREQRNRKGLMVVDWIIDVNRIILLDNTTGILEIDKDMNFKKPISQSERNTRKIDKEKLIELLANFDIQEWDSRDPRSFEQRRLSENRKRMVLEEIRMKLRMINL